MAEEAQASGVLVSELLTAGRGILADSTDIVRLGRHYGENRFTTKEMIALEQSLIACAGRLAATDSHQLASETVIRVLSQSGSSLSEEQMKAVWHITMETGAFAGVSGIAGSGKTRTLSAARNAWESEGYRIEGTAVATLVARELEENYGVPSQTITRLLLAIEKGHSALDAKSILVVDEAGMVATPELERLVRHCEAVGAKLVLIGDERQLQPIGPGAPFLELGKRLGYADLQDIRRQNESWAKKAVKDIAEGRAREALEAFVSRGLVTVSETQMEAMQSLVSAWRADGLPLTDTLILAATRADVAALNHLAQAERLATNEIGGVPVFMASDTFYLGDRVLFTKNHKAMGVINGEYGVLQNIDTERGRASVVLDSGEKVSFEVDAIEDISLGYAATTHKAQGATTMRAYILAGGFMQDRELSYVQASRSEEKTTFYLTRLEAGDEIARLAKAMERSRQKSMAHSLVREQPEFQYSVQPDSEHDRQHDRPNTSELNMGESFGFDDR
ncbi:hypothetical protein LBMAG21_00220 [Armatimonadota bacterium]|nr:hypothetical protein LBMAG21_00220 [Armatimonadota bacterium]